MNRESGKGFQRTTVSIKVTRQGNTGETLDVPEIPTGLQNIG